MARPRKLRRVCFLPQEDKYGPISSQKRNRETINMTVDEYEAIRLIDLEEMTQEQCADKMNVARTTVQRIYNIARKKIAKSLVNGQMLKIEGGDFKLCSEGGPNYGCGRCRKRKAKNELV